MRYRTGAGWSMVVVALMCAAPSWMGEMHGRVQVVGRQAGDLDAEVAAVAALEGEPSVVSAGGLTLDLAPLVTLENPSPFDPPGPRRRLVLVGGLDGNPESARVVLDAVRWFKTDATADDRERWSVSALPLANPGGTPDIFPPDEGFFSDGEHPETRYVWRWVTYQTPDLVIEVRAGNALQIQSSDGRDGPFNRLPRGSLAAALSDPDTANRPGPVDTMLVRASDGAGALRAVLALAGEARSVLRQTITERIEREPLEVARLLAARYPRAASIAYIPAVAWVHTLRLAALTEDSRLRDQVLADVRPWLEGEQPIVGDRVSLAGLAGTMVFAEIAKSARDTAVEAAAAGLAAEGIALAAAETESGMPEHGSGWTDDMFLGTIAAVTARDPDGLAAATRLLVRYGGELQQADGIFHHSPEAPTAWGRGNGFAALGLTETLTVLPSEHPARTAIMEIYHRHMSGLRDQQAPDGMWRQVVDVPGSYRELSVTALTVTSMARGLQLGWLDESYAEVVERGWRGLLAHIDRDGVLVDVCISTGDGPTLRHYLDRTAVNGADDRGGALALGAALEMYALLESR